MKNKSIAFLLILFIASSDLLIASNALHLQRNHAQVGLHLEQSVPTKAVNQAASVVNGVKAVVEAFKTDDTMSKVAKAVKSLGALGGSLGALGAVLTVIDLFFTAGQQSDVDKITNRIEATEIKILNAIGDAVATTNIQNRKQQLATIESKINSAASYLKKMRQCQNKPKSQANTNEFNANKKQFLKDAKDTDDYIEQISDTFKTTFSNGEPLPIAISRTSAGNWKIVKAAVEKLTLLLIQAQINYSAYLNLQDKDSLATFQKDFTSRLNAIATFIQGLPKQNFDIASTSIINGLTDTVKTTCNNDNGFDQNGNCANLLATYYKNKYPDLKFDIFVYNDESRSDANVHGFSGQNCAWTQAQRKDVFLCYVSDAQCVKKTTVSSAQFNAQSRIDLLKPIPRGRAVTYPTTEGLMISDAQVKQQFYYREGAPTLQSSLAYEASSKGWKSLGWLMPAYWGFVFEEAKPTGVNCFWTATTLTR